VEEGVVKTVDPELEKMRFEHEERRKKMEMELRLAEMAAEKEKLDAERAAEKEKLDVNVRLVKERLELEQAKLGMERMKLQHEKDLKQVDMNEKAKEDGNVVKQLKRFGDALAQVIGPQPADVTDLPSYFQGVEAQFTKLDVPATYQARLIHKYLAPKARALCSRMDPKVRDDYTQMKNAILKEYGLTAKCFLDKFNTLKKNTRETYVMFSSKLKGLLTQCLTSRSVTTFDGLQSLLLSDRIKSALPEHCLKHVLSVESNLEKPCWLQPDKLVQVIDEYMSNVGYSPNVNQLPVGQNAGSRFNAGTRFSVPNVGHNEAKSVSNQATVKPGNPVDNNGEVKRCHRCNSAFHLIAQCPQDRPTGQRRTQSGQSGQRRQSVNACSTTDSSVGSRDHSLTQASGGRPLLAAAATPATQPAATDGLVAYVNKVTVQDDLDFSRPLYTWNESSKSQSCCESVCDMPEGADFTDGLFDDLDSSDGRSSGCSHERKPIEVGLPHFNIHRFVADCQAAMHYVDLHIADVSGNQLTVNSLFDSGTQISVLKASAVESLAYAVLGKVTLQTFDKRASVGDLLSFDVKIDGARSYHPIRFVVCANVSHDCLLSLADYRGLLAVAG